MAYVKRKRIKEHDYYYLVETYRERDKVKTRTLAYLGRTPDVPPELSHLVGRPRRRRRQRLIWDPAALGEAIRRKVQSGPITLRKEVGS
jgi:hypothetical protein